MRLFNPKMSMELTHEDINYINKLIEKDTAKPMKEYEYASGDGQMALCPCCERVINVPFPYCPWCGQKVDNTLYEL